MKLKASLLVTASFMTLVLVAIGLLRSSSPPALESGTNPNALALVSPLLPSIVPLSSSHAPDGVDALLDRPLQAGTSTNRTLNQRLAVDRSIDRVKQIDRALASPQTIANGRKDLATQAMHQRLASVTGTLKKQDYEIKKLSFELAQKQFQDGEIPKTRLDQQQASYQKSAHELKTFLNSSKIAD